MILGALLGAGNFSRSTSSPRRRRSSGSKLIAGELSPLALSGPMRGVIVKTWFLGSKCNRMLNLKMCRHPQHVITLLSISLLIFGTAFILIRIYCLDEELDEVALVLR
jgi:hypothetical protein